jgi:hypothetical protein
VPADNESYHEGTSTIVTLTQAAAYSTIVYAVL